MAVRAELGDLLRSQRDRLSPQEVGLVDDRPRRVPGLRREEVARLAGVSVDHYTRIEQGRDVSVSGEVLDAIADALQLDEGDRATLFDIVEPTRSRRRAPSAPRVRHSVETLVALLPVPALVIGRRLDVLASNLLARALLCDFDSLPRDRRNEARWIFLDPISRERYVDWETVAGDTVARLREHVHRYPEDPKLARLVGELGTRSAEFQALWRDDTVSDTARQDSVERRYEHPSVGALTLRHEELVVVDADDQVIHVDVAEPGSRAETALLRLAETGHPAHR